MRTVEDRQRAGSTHESGRHLSGAVLAVAAHRAHRFSKTPQLGIRLLAGLGVAGDAHCGATVQHRSRVARDPSQPNLRQVHLFATEMLDALNAEGFRVAPGALGENVTTQGIDLLALPRGTRLRLGAAALLRVTGLRNPCVQLDRFQPGLMAALIGRDAADAIVWKAGVMAVVETGGEVLAGDPIGIELPPPPHRRLELV